MFCSFHKAWTSCRLGLKTSLKNPELLKRWKFAQLGSCKKAKVWWWGKRREIWDHAEGQKFDWDWKYATVAATACVPGFLSKCPPAYYLYLYVLKSTLYSSSIFSTFTTFTFGLSHKDCCDIIERTNKIGKELPILAPVFFYIFDRHMSLMMTPLSEVRQREWPPIWPVISISLKCVPGVYPCNGGSY